jgi:hypothetical protein
MERAYGARSDLRPRLLLLPVKAELPEICVKISLG